jgi:hypothetical protein
MTVFSDVRSFIVAHSPRAVCDDCIATGLGLSVRQHANHKTRELERMPRFNRRVQTCSVCGHEKKSIAYA